VDQIVKKNAFLTGVVGAAITAACYLYMWQTQSYQSIAMAVIIYAMPLALGIAAQVICKNKLGGYITLKQTVLAFFLTVLLIFVTEAVINYLIFVIWDPEAQEIVQQLQAAAVEERKASSNAAVQISEIDYSATTYLTAATSKLLFYTAVGILIGFFIRRNPPAA
jgi:hypothetical protein